MLFQLWSLSFSSVIIVVSNFPSIQFQLQLLGSPLWRLHNHWILSVHAVHLLNIKSCRSFKFGEDILTHVTVEQFQSQKGQSRSFPKNVEIVLCTMHIFVKGRSFYIKPKATWCTVHSASQTCLDTSNLVEKLAARGRLHTSASYGKL